MKKLVEGVNWNYFNKFDDLNSKYLPNRGEGDNMATQIVTAVNKLIYKWYNDGDVYDNVNSPMEGWANDLSSYANWLEQNVPEVSDILKNIWDCYNSDDYEEDVLRPLADTIFREEFLSKYAESPRKGSVYDTDGVFKWGYPDEDEEDEW